MTSLQRRPADDRAPGLRRSVNLTIDADLVARAEQVTPDLSATVEALLTAFLAPRAAGQDADRHAIDNVVDAVNRFHERNGFLSDGFPTL